jgi:hypothetical protein
MLDQLITNYTKYLQESYAIGDNAKYEPPQYIKLWMGHEHGDPRTAGYPTIECQLFKNLEQLANDKPKQGEYILQIKEIDQQEITRQIAEKRIV